MAAAVLLAYIPRLPSRRGASAVALTGGSGRLTPGTSRRLRAFATIQIACSFVLLAGAGALVAALLALQSAHTVYETRQVLVLDVPPVATGIAGSSMIEVLQRATRRIAALPGVRGVASGSFVPWRDAGTFAGFTFATEGYEPAKGEESPYGRFRIVSPGFFAVLGVPLLAGRDFGPEDGRSSEPVVMVSQSLAQRMFPNAASREGGRCRGPIRWSARPAAPHRGRRRRRR
jgi:putative ABC transport system permease protein